MELNKIYNEDCLETLARMDDECVDLIVTSPPYNKNAYASASGDTKSWSNLRGRQIAYDQYADNLPPQEYEQWQKKVIKECLRVLKPSGSLFYNHKDILSEGKIIAPKWVYDFDIHQQIIWNRGSSLANDVHYFQPITEYIYWIVKDAKKTLFHKEKTKYRQTVWNINFETNTRHPAPFPEKLVANIILSCTDTQNIVYDPFMGGGTTAVVATRFQRNFIGSEISADYVKYAESRIKNENAQLKLF